MAQVNPLWRQIVLTAADDGGKLAQSLVDWWQLAGVDWDYRETPYDWMADDPRETSPRGSATVVPSASASARKSTGIAAPGAEQILRPSPPIEIPLPGDLTAFQAAWRTGAFGADGGVGPYLMPTGPIRPRIMVITGAPEQDDRDTVLSGSTGRLFENMVRSTGLDLASLYRASLFPRLVLDNRAAFEHIANWRRIALHHVALVEPDMLVVAGEETAKSLLGHDPSQKPPALHFLNHGDRTYKTVVLRKLSLMLHRIAPEKSMAWQNIQLLLVE